MRHVLVFLALVLGGCLAAATHDGRWPCASSSDCNGGDVCRPLQYRSVCAPSDYCEADLDCQDSHVFSTQFQNWSCVANHCLLPSCSSDASCAPYVCSSLSTCLTSCTTDTECTAGARCTGWSCESVSCGGDADCPSGSLCTSGTCGSRNCTYGLTGQCDGFACTGAGQCATACSASVKCYSGLVCAGNGNCQCDQTACGAYRCTARGCSTSCASDADCAFGHVCNAGTCQACTGGAITCANQASCSLVPGCSTSQACVGGTIDCALYNGSAGLCGGIVGCTYNSALGQCQGATGCANQLVSACPSQLGCTVSSVCAGTPLPCAQLSASLCTKTLGCTLQ